MENKGFTLVELLATLTILAILAVIVFPNIFGILNRSNESAYESQVDSIINGAKNYYADHAEQLPDDGFSHTVTLGTLKEGNYVDKDIENPLTGELFNDEDSVTVSNHQENYTYEFQEKNTWK